MKNYCFLFSVLLNFVTLLGYAALFWGIEFHSSYPKKEPQLALSNNNFINKNCFTQNKYCNGGLK